MNALFSKLFSLRLKHSNNPTEDFLTTIFAHILEENESILEAFFIEILKKSDPIKKKYISTQAYLPKLLNKKHSVDSIPDIVITTDKHSIFIESKIDSKENKDTKQLKRYAEHLDEYLNFKTLVYLTKDDDPKCENEITKDCKSKVIFLPVRWFQIFHFLKQFKENELVKETLKLMKNMNLDAGNHFNPTDIISLSNFNRVIKMMKKCLDGQVFIKMKEIVEKTSDQRIMTEVRDNDRFVYLYEDKEKWFGFGFWFNGNNEKMYPEIRVQYEIKSKKNSILALEAIKEIIKNPNWMPYKNLSNPNSFSGFYFEKSLKDFLNEENHVEKIQKELISRVEELKMIKEKHKEVLPF